MTKKGLTEMIFIWILIAIVVIGSGIFIYQQYTSEYKYTAIISCYDNYGNKINNLTCEKEINCGFGANYDNTVKQTFPCDYNKYNGKFVISKQEVVKK